MAIKIIEDGPDITLTHSEHERLAREWRQMTSYMVNPPSFEQFVRNQRRAAPAQSDGLDLGSDAPLTACPIPGNGETCESCQ